ncbi:cobyric acid synthase [Athalassotoga saccharophila]|uniref:cobyric acid synthase n=1 Tax=Athalassotoga saccharophila TaxID=1441386 RepID=UPI0018D73757|nr:cobyric acid synthase [Athalassotoga saccharophila]BBJ27995.1 cobyric acid synthase [Athalassotoga saccharophila]
MKTLMVQGTSSGAGKSLITMALCRHFKRKGLSVAPFKSQNMSLNSAVSVEGGEMSRSQYLQSIACEEPPSVKMNPILLKPEIDGSQIIFLGKPYGHINARDYMYSKKEEFLSRSLESLGDLIKTHDIVIVEGAGSPVEINLKSRDIVNMSIAKAFNIPVILVTDIERGGSFAQIVGTMELLEKDERSLVRGYLFNKFMGDKSLLGNYPEIIAKRYGIDFFGVMPYVNHKLPEEDSMIEWRSSSGKDLNVDIIRLPHISNFDDFDPLIWNTNLRFVQSGPLNGDIIIIPGTKMTIEDLEWVKNSKLDIEIKNAAKRGSYIVGICGGYQMLGEELRDAKKCVKGFGLLPVITEFRPEKVTSNLEGIENLTGKSIKIEGYEIHHGISITRDSHPFAQVKRVNGKETDYEDGYIEGRIFGTYFHGLFRNFDFTQEFLNILRASKKLEPKTLKAFSIIEEIDKFTDVFESNIDVKRIEELI